MAKPGRKPKFDRPAVWKCNIPSSLKLAVEAQLSRNPKGKIPLSEKGDLTAMLLTRWLDERHPPPDLSDLINE